MKKIILVFAILLLTLGSAAQTKPEVLASKKTKTMQVVKKRKKASKPIAAKEDFQKVKERDESQIKKAITNYYVVLKKGEVFIIDDGKSTILKNEVTTADGTKIFPSGKYITPDGYGALLNDGQSFDIPRPIEDAASPAQQAEFTRP